MARAVAANELKKLLKSFNTKPNAHLAQKIFQNPTLLPAQANETIQKIIQNNIVTYRVYSSYLTYYAHQGQVEEVEKGIKDAQKYEISTADNWLTELTQAHAKRKDLEKTWNTICEMREKGFNLKDYPFMFCLQNLGHSRQGLTAFTELAKSMKQEGMQISRVVIGYFISLCREMDDVEGIQSWIQELKEQNMVITVMDYMHLINNYLKRKEYGKAEEWFVKMQSDVTPDIGFYNSFVLTYLKSGELERANQWLEKIKEKKWKSNEQLYSFVVSSFAAKDELQLAEKWWEEAAQYGLGNSSLEVLMKEYIKRGKIEDAERLVAKVEERETKAKSPVYNLLKSAYNKSGDVEKANEISKQTK